MSDLDAAEQDERARRDVDDAKAIKALVLWVADKTGTPRAQARDEILAIYKSL